MEAPVTASLFTDVDDLVDLAHTLPRTAEAILVRAPHLATRHSSWGESCLQAASHLGHRRLLMNLMEEGVRLDLFAECSLGRPASAVAALKARGSELLGVHDLPILHFGVISRDPATIDNLLGAGASVNSPQASLSPLHSAVACGDASLVVRLVEAGADPLAVDAFGSSVVDWAICLHGDDSSLARLLRSVHLVGQPVPDGAAWKSVPCEIDVEDHAAHSESLGSRHAHLADLRPEAVAAIKAVRAAIVLISQRTGANQVARKAGLDLVTGTDLATEATLRATLSEEHGEYGFVGEESGADRDPAGSNYWLVDPICGTSNFANRLPLYCVNVALVEIEIVVLGVVADGASGQVWIAERGRGAWAERAGRLTRTGVSPASDTVSLDPGRPGGATADKAALVIAAAIRDGRWELRTLGTSLDLAMLATGRVSGVWHFSKIAPLHFAAGVLLAEEAGALVTDDSGAPWTLDSTSLVAAATPDLHRSLLDLLAT